MIHPVNSIDPGTADQPPPEVCSPGDIAKNNPPPSYESLFGKIKRAKVESSGSVDFARKCCSVCTGSVIFAVVLCFILAFLISMIAIGSIYLRDCPAEDKIPIFLVVNGVVSTVLILLGFVSFIKNSKKEKEKPKPKTDSSKKKEKRQECSVTIFTFFLIGWFIFGCSRIYKAEWVSSPADARNYCHPTVYYFAFWSVTSVFIFLATIVALSICACVYECICTKKK